MPAKSVIFQFAKTEIDSPGWRDEPWRMSVVVAVADGYAPDWVETGKAEKGELKLRLPTGRARKTSRTKFSIYSAAPAYGRRRQTSPVTQRRA